ncbi:MAG: acyl-CoA thioesterase [Prochloraceae cyanobacterium]|nr:acyl-CoA thioesterase [Prochloraceae cyanobacterium]
MAQIYQHTQVVPSQAIDQNGHVNNVEYVRWMQQTAELHSDHQGCTQASRKVGATWVARSHKIEYFRPAWLSEEIAILTWVSNWRRVRSLRKYKFVRLSDRSILAAGETEWIFVDAQSFRPLTIPETILSLFELVCPTEEAAKLENFLREQIWSLNHD